MVSSMSPASRRAAPSALWLAWLVLGAGLAALAWVLPVNVKSLNSALLREAGRGTPSVAGFGRSLLDRDKPGPAVLVLAAAEAAADPGAAPLRVVYDDYARRHPEMMPWGGWDAALEPLLQGEARPAEAASQPVLTFMVRQRPRDNLRAYLAVSRLPGVQTLLRTADLTGTTRFVPARSPGGQPLDAVILLTAYLWQSEHLDPALAREVRALAEGAVGTGHLGELEAFYLDLLTLGKRLDWTQLSELLRSATSTATVGQFAHLARVAPEHLPVSYTATLMTRSADAVARYLITFGHAGAENLRLALGHGEGALKQLVERQVPVSGTAGPEFEFGAGFALRHPDFALFLKYAAFLGGLYLLFRAVDTRLFTGIEAALRGAFPRMGGGVLALILTFIFFVFSEPYLLKAAQAPDFQVKLAVPILGAAPAVADASPPPSMQNSTLISVLFFAALQVAMYVICLLKISEIDRQAVPSAVKLRLAENEENLFDGGLYIGIAGTAAALVLQVMQVIEANLLAAYSSNLFGIVCVALVKIRHVRPYKRKLILDLQQAPAAA